ncbi:MAG: glycosyltransferase [Fimbriimonadaceae bacterium]|nr:glycosyltransferase [Fimbriimonadaceae bacterium]
MQRIVTIMGTDGSGKTTLASALVDQLREQDIAASREWLAAESYIMAPIRKVLRARWRKGTSAQYTAVEANSASDVAQKQAMVTRYRWAKRLYLGMVLLDYRLQLMFKLFRNRRSDLIVADRYLFDVMVNASLTLGLSPDETVELLQRQIARLTLPQVRVFLRVEPEISMQRKDDIPDIEYLRLRFSYYEAIAEAFGFVVLDGTLRVRDNSEWLRDYVVASLAKPYVHYVHANNEDVGGADFVLVSMAQHMRSQGQGYRTAVSLRLPTAAVRAHAERGTPVFLTPVVRPQMTAGVGGLLRLAVKGPITLAYFCRLFGREKPDIVHVNDLYDFLPAIAARIRRIPVAYHIRMIRTGIVCKFFSCLLPRISNKIIPVSDAVRRVYDPQGIRGDLLRVIHDFGNPVLVQFPGDVSINQPRPPGLMPGERLVIMVGRIQEWKGQRVFLEAVMRLPEEVRQRHAFVLVGGGVEGRSGYWGSPEYVQEVAAEAERLGVQWLGERKDIPDLLLAADISVHCSIKPDPFPGVVVESLLAGAATVAADVGGVPEMIDVPEVGVLYAPGDAASLSDHLLRLLTQKTSPRTEYALAARTRALQLVAPEAVDGQLDDVYRELLGTCAGRGANYQPLSRRVGG